MAISASPPPPSFLGPVLLRSEGGGGGGRGDGRFQGHGHCRSIAFPPRNPLLQNYKFFGGVCPKGSRIDCRNINSSLLHPELDLAPDFDGFQLDPKATVEDKNKNPTSLQLDQWIHNSVSEIVKNTRKAPFLVHVYPEDDGIDDEGSPSSSSTTSTRLVFEEASSATWPCITRRWKDVNSTTPAGVILVQELQAVDDEDKCLDDSTKLWGLLVQGRGLTCPACYVLKTCQIQCCFGFSTHFCLSKVECSGIGTGTGRSTDSHLYISGCQDQDG
ncbi:hypothetical protein Dimus_032669 [Dionaea muscipula]